MKNQTTELRVLKRKVESIQAQITTLLEYKDTIESHPLKRFWWWFGGYHYHRVGRWYSDKSKLFKIWYSIARLIRCT